MFANEGALSAEIDRHHICNSHDGDSFSRRDVSVLGSSLCENSNVGKWRKRSPVLATHKQPLGVAKRRSLTGQEQT